MGDRFIATDGGTSETGSTPVVPWYESQTPNRSPIMPADNKTPGLTDLPDLNFDMPGRIVTPRGTDAPELQNAPKLQNTPELQNNPGLNNNPEQPQAQAANTGEKADTPRKDDHLGYNAGGDLAILGITTAQMSRFLNPTAVPRLSFGMKAGGNGLAVAGIAIGALTEGNMTPGAKGVIAGAVASEVGEGLVSMSSACPKLRPIGLAVEFLGKASMLGGTLKRLDELGEHYL